MKHRLTKTAYLNYLCCPTEFWLEHHEPLLAGSEKMTLEREHLRQQGYAVERYVKMLGRFRADQTISVDMQRTFQTAEFLARSDIAVTHNATGVVDLYEVKAAASVKQEHLDDVAFQKMVCEHAGVAVGRCHVVTMNGDYIRCGDIDVEKLFVITDVTDQIEERMDDTRQKAQDAIAYLGTVPIPSLVEYCNERKLDCRFIKLHFPGLPEYTIFDIARLNNDKRRRLLSDGIIDIHDVPDDFDLSKKQREQVAAAKSKLVHIDRKAIGKRIASWQYPLHFLDYETFAFAIPQFDGVRPFQQMCFQYSLHTIPAPGADIKHSFFLARNESSPARAMAARLMEDMAGEIGTVFVWYEPFEKGRNSEMAEMYPEYADFFNKINDHTYDLMKIFSDNLYVHPEFKGRSSIKKVLPVLRPELSYQDLGIGDGMTASISWFRAATWDNLEDAERESIFSDLEKYCELDTLAMVEIYKELVSAAGLAAPQLR